VDIRMVAFVLSRLALVESLVLLLPLAMAVFGGESGHSAISLLLTLGLALLVGLELRRFGQPAIGRQENLTQREGIAITGLGWLMVTGLGMLPYVLSGSLGLLDGIFESISGFTGTGATVLESIESLPPSLLFWRMMTHWFGGLGIIVIFIAILPPSGASTMHMYDAETSGPTRERVLPHLRDMTIALLRLYAGFTLVATLVYLLCGMGPFAALTHAMSTIGAGGFSIYDDSAMHFDSSLIEGWMTFFMIVAGGNFALYYRALHKGPRVLWHDAEFRVYLGILAVAMCLITLILMQRLGLPLGQAFRYASFQVGSLATTGFVSADFDQWPGMAKGILLLLMIIGGCAGSTAAGIKVSRVMLLAKNAWAVVHQKISPRRVVEVRLNGRKVDQATLWRVGQFFFVYMFGIALWSLLLAFDGISTFDAISISISSFGCVGPAFGIAGATCTYAGLSAFAKGLLCISMLLGRLELFTLLVMLTPEFWKLGHRW